MVETLNTDDGERSRQQKEIANTAKGLLKKIQMTELDAHVRVRPHRSLARRREIAAVVSAWVAAFSAGISTVSIFADQKPAAATLALIATAFTTFTVAAKPAERSADHSSRAATYKDCEDKMRNLYFDLTDTGAAASEAGLQFAQNTYGKAYVPFQQCTLTDSVERDTLWSDLEKPPEADA